MCGRYSLSTPIQTLATTLSAAVDPRLEPQPPRYNVAPTNVMPVLRVVEHRRWLVPARWGLVPHWAHDLGVGSSMINARSETLFEKAAFRDSLPRRRCLVVVDGVYEWQLRGTKKVPMRVAYGDGRPFTLAGLWARWRGAGVDVESFTIVTMTAIDELRPLHERMPVIVDDGDRDAWLDPDCADVDLVRFASPRPRPELTVTEVSSRVGNVRNDDAGVLQPDIEPPSQATAARRRRRTAAQGTLI
jgi:putative SOS response-associated peptidase YedK